jgi:CheY-like chemotaxis protein
MTYVSHFPTAPLQEALNSLAETEQPRPPVLLVVDDEWMIVESLSMILTQAGFAVMKAYDGASALELARLIPPDLLITDIAMPGMNGIELAVALVCLAPDSRVLLFSAHAQTQDLLAARSAGFDFPLLSKPVPPRTMLDGVKQCLATAQPFPPRARAHELAQQLQMAS